MDLTKYIDSSDDLHDLASSQEIRSAKTLLSATNKRIEELRDWLEKKSEIDNPDFRKDFRYILGQIKGCQFILELTQQAQQIIEKERE